jgi:hypothetical protein
MSQNISADVLPIGAIVVEFVAGPLIMFWALQRLRDGKKVDDWSGDNRDAVADAVALDPASLQTGDTFPFSMAILAPAVDSAYDAIVRVVQNGQSIAEARFQDTLKANKAVNCAGVLTLTVGP